MAVSEEQLGEQLAKAVQIVEEKVDDELHKLDALDDDELERIRQKRLEQMAKRQRQLQDWVAMGHGEYTELTSDREFFDASKRSARFVCHFFGRTTERRVVFDKHLDVLARRHRETRFVRVDVERAPFVVERLRVRVLPTLAVVRDGRAEHYLRGFDELGGGDDFSTQLLEWRLGQLGALDYAGDLSRKPTAAPDARLKSILGVKPKRVRGGANDYDDSDSDC